MYFCLATMCSWIHFAYMYNMHIHCRDYVLVLLLWAGCWSRSVSIHNKTKSHHPPPLTQTHNWCDAHFIVGCYVAACSITLIQPWWVFWVHILIPSWCARFKRLRFAALSSVSLSWGRPYAFCWIMQLGWKQAEKHLAVVNLDEHVWSLSPVTPQQCHTKESECQGMVWRS